MPTHLKIELSYNIYILTVVSFLIVSSLHEHEVEVVGSEESLFAVAANVEVEFAVAPPNREDASSPPPLIRSADSSRPFNSVKDATDCCWSEPPSPLGGRGRLLRPKFTMLALFSWGIPCSAVVELSKYVSYIEYLKANFRMIWSSQHVTSQSNNDDSFVAPVHAPLVCNNSSGVECNLSLLTCESSTPLLSSS